MDIQIKWNEQGLIPAVAQDVDSGRVLMVAYMNQEAFDKTVESGFAHFFSRSRNQLWKKGESSGNTLAVVAMAFDCDADTLLMQVRPAGPACHTGAVSCFFQEIQSFDGLPHGANVLTKLYEVIDKRKQQPLEGSYTNYLFDKGVDKICKKVGEEAAECIIAAKNGSVQELTYEAADLMYHLLVLLCQQNIRPETIFEELAGRYNKPKESKK